MGHGLRTRALLPFLLLQCPVICSFIPGKHPPEPPAPGDDDGLHDPPGFRKMRGSQSQLRSGFLHDVHLR